MLPEEPLRSLRILISRQSDAESVGGVLDAKPLPVDAIPHLYFRPVPADELVIE
jgi:hypothetical protein